MTEPKHKRVKIKSAVRQRLWIAAAGRCEFKHCNRPVGHDFLTGKKGYVGEMAHIIADSKDGPRGDPVLSAKLAQDESNLLLACPMCHDRIDTVWGVEEFPVETLRRWKREHEARIEKIYGAEVGTLSQPVILSLPVGSLIPDIKPEHVHAAILKNSDYTVHPLHEPLILNRTSFHVRDDEGDYWRVAGKTLADWYTTVLEPRLAQAAYAPHVSIAAFAPIPMLMKLGSLIGDKRPAHVMDLPNDGWMWRTDAAAQESADDWFHFEVPDKLPAHVFAAFDISNVANGYESLVGNTPVVRFSAKTPQRSLIGSHKNLQGFRRKLDAFLLQLQRAGVQELDLLPATSLSASVEIGRALLPKIFKRVSVWEYRAGHWTKALNLVG